MLVNVCVLKKEIFDEEEIGDENEIENSIE